LVVDEVEARTRLPVGTAAATMPLKPVTAVFERSNGDGAMKLKQKSCLGKI
jgi:hypothetical protein